MKKIISVVGARPNFVKVAPIHRAFLKKSELFDHRIIHTGQHYDATMSDAFFTDLEMPQPSWFLGVGSGSHAEQSARVMVGFEKVCLEHQPDYIIVVGDVNSTVACALTSVKMGITTAHVESGLRSYDRAMPEEINRMATDAIVDHLFVTEESGRVNLLREGASPDRIFFVGNTMIDSLLNAVPAANNSTILKRLSATPKEYVLVTLHRPSNVDIPEQLQMLTRVLENVAQSTPIIFPVHPRTRKMLAEIGFAPSKNITIIDPVGYIDFLCLMKNSKVVLTDSGGIQEETTALGVACVTARTSTERPSTIELGTNILVQPTEKGILAGIRESLAGRSRSASVPPLWDGNAADRIVDVVARHYS
ncbi:MAG: UDP-N-acetylglucosamine 2-epimerase (non-hydrolyzing) [Ignavibacteria bacterium]|nr:UDP-N-acetylglucosamine 2-epimerase (non-hydrolyzing) [Ignavibacteria bacterium]